MTRITKPEAKTGIAHVGLGCPLVKMMAAAKTMQRPTRKEKERTAKRMAHAFRLILAMEKTILFISILFSILFLQRKYCITSDKKFKKEYRYKKRTFSQKISYLLSFLVDLQWIDRGSRETVGPQWLWICHCKPGF